MESNALDILNQTQPFAALTVQDRRDLAPEMIRKRFPKGEILAVQNKTVVEHVLVIVSGTLELFFEENGQRTISGELHAGDIFGGISLLMNAGLAVRTVQAKTDTLAFVMLKKDFLSLCTRQPNVAKFFVDEFSHRMLDESYAELMAATQAAKFLNGIDPFSFLPENEIEKAAAKLDIVRQPKNKVLFIQGKSRVDALYIVQKGAAERYFEEKNKKMLSGLMGEGDIFGGISMLLNDGFSVRTLKTIEPTTFYTLPKGDFLDLCSRFEAFSEYFTDTFGKRMLDRSYAKVISSSLQPREEGARFFNQPVASIYNPRLITCPAQTSIRQAAVEMNSHRCSSIFITRGEEEFVGVVTDNDLRRKVIAEGYDIEKPVSDIMTQPLKTVHSQALIFEALMTMMQHNIKHLAVADTEGRVVGLVTNRDLLTAQGQSPFFLIREIMAADTVEAIFDMHGRLPRLIQSLINSGAKAMNITRFITTISDAITKRIIEFALEKCGPPPVPFVFMILGSEGRQEQTLKTDQDNAIVYEDVAGEQEAETQAYFLKLAKNICTWLDKAGYAFCEGNVMAQNPQWCGSLTKWKNYFSSWIHAAEPEDLLQASIFFDFRGAYGEMRLIDELRQFLFESLAGWSGFFRHLTENALHFKPPLGFFRNFVVASKGEHRNTFDIKSAMMPIVDFARIYALKNSLEETNTLERLHQLYLKKKLSWQEYNDLDQGYSFMMQLRFVRQIESVVEENAKPDNYINPKKLSRIEQTMLKEIFKRIEKFQTKLSVEFTGLP
jgi:CBS domain-containing protein